MNATLISQKELSDFDRDGHLIVRRMYNRRQIGALSDCIDALIARGPRVGQEMFYYEDSLLEKGSRILSRIEKFAECDENFKNFVRGEPLMDRVSQLLGERAVLFKEKINFKLPGGGGFAAHQDIQPGWDDYARYFISVLVTIDSSTVENGCLELAAGQHKRGLFGRKWTPLEGKELEGLEFRAYPMEPGDVAFFDCFVPHQSKPNLTRNPRRNFYLTFNRESEGNWREQYFADKRKSYPPDNEREAGKVYVFRV